MRNHERLDYAVFEKNSEKKITKGKGDIVEEMAFLAKKFNVKDELIKEIGRNGAWYDK